MRTTPMSFRKLQVATKTEGLQAAQYENLFADIYYYLAHYIDFHPAKILFDIDYRSISMDDIEKIASDVRRHWGLGDGPIPDMMRLLENNGIMIADINLPSTLDAVSTWRHDRPFILLGNYSTSCRLRFNLGHELGHLVLHRMVSKEDFENPDLHKKLEKQAHRFAGAFLFPARSVSHEYFSNSIKALINLKSRWKISIQAIAMRLFDLSLINEYQKKYIIMNIPDRKNEPLDDVLPKEEPILIKQALEMVSENNILSIRNAVDDLMISDKIFTMLTGTDVQNITEKNVIPFELRRTK